MVLIITDENDQTTCEVIDWLYQKGNDVCVITDASEVKIIKIYEDGSFIISVNTIEVSSVDVTSVWYRRGGISISKQKLPNSQLNGALNILSNNLLIERKRLVDYIYYKLASIRHLGEYNRVDVNKLIVLDLCRKYDILIPPSLLTTSKRDLLIFFKNHAPIITKSATTTIFGADKLVHLCAFTESLSETTIQNLPSFFAPSFFQANVLKRFEIRVFFIEEHFFAMAIFSQQNTRTQTDFRHYDDNKPNRMVPFKVPGQLKKKLMYLMDELELRTGSIDLIYSRDKEFYFLEVNPIGQFGMTSAPCNYNLEEKVAEYLSENSRHIKL